MCLFCCYFYIVLSLHLYCCYVVYLHCNISLDLLLLLHCFIFILVLLLCCVSVSRSSLYCNIRSDLCSQCFSYYYFYIVLSLHLYCCYVVHTDHHFTVITVQTRVQSVFVLLLFLHCFILILVLLLCCVSISSLYCNIPSDLCTLCLSCYYFYIVLSLYLYCCYVLYLDYHFTVIYLQTSVLCVCLVITSTLFYLYTCTVAMLCIQIITLV